MYDRIYRFVFPFRVTFYYKSGNVITLRCRAYHFKETNGVLTKVSIGVHPWSRKRIFNLNIDQIETIMIG